MSLWTSQEDDVLRNLVETKHLSPGTIALKFGDLLGHRSRNALIGRASRIGVRLARHSYRKAEDWPPERLQCLKTYYFGALGYGITDIARLMAMTEEQIKYGISRLRRALTRAEKSAGAPHKRPARGKGARELLKGPLTPAPTNQPVKFIDLRLDHCRAPHTGTGAEMTYCGAPKLIGAYCGHHAAQFYVVP